MTLRAEILVVVLSLVVAACASTQQPVATTPFATPPAPADPTEPFRGEAVLAESSGRAVADGVFKASQASSGQRTFRQVCSACHGPEEFSGARFRFRWAGQTVGDVFNAVSTLMPEDNPGSLRPEEYADILAYLLSLNDYPAGNEPLPADVAVLATIQMEVASGR